MSTKRASKLQSPKWKNSAYAGTRLIRTGTTLSNLVLRVFLLQLRTDYWSGCPKATVQRILDTQPLPPHKVTYYLERRDPRFLPKMQEVLLVYQQVALQNEAVRKGAAQP